MNPEDFQKFRDGIAGVMDFYGKSLSSFALDIWWNALNAYDLAVITEAFNRHLANPDTGQFVPKPADIIRMLQGSTQDSALRAWATVDKAVHGVGPYSDVVFDDPLVHRIIHDMGGWIVLCSKLDNEWPFVAKEFENRYRGDKTRDERLDYPAKLIGLITAHNEQKGFSIEPPILVGNELKAKNVLHGGSDRLATEFKRMEIDLEGLRIKEIERKVS